MNLKNLEGVNKMPKKFHWDVIRAIGVIGGILGIIFSILMIVDIWGPIGGVLAPSWESTTIVIISCCVIVIVYAILGWDVWEVRFTFFLWLVIGILLIVLFGNLAGILLVVAAIPIPFGS
jgi:hypothetical protein